MKTGTGGAEVDERLAALISNANAIRAIAAAVEGTIGPKGLDTMLVDRFGEVTITNDGVTILEQMDVNHPAARMLINVARAQQDEIGDGTTTCTILAKALISEGVNHVIRGVPVVRVIEGMRYGIERALQIIKEHAIPVESLDDPILERIAYIAGRENKDIAELVVQAARLIGVEKLKDDNFRLADTVLAQEGADNEVFMGLVLDRQRLNSQMPEKKDAVKVLVLDDDLDPEEIEEEALGTETGFSKYLELQEEFRQNLSKLVDLGVGLVLTSRTVHNIGEEVLTDAGIFVVDRLASDSLRLAAEHTGARLVKRSALKKPASELETYLGFAGRVYEDEKLGQVRILGGQGKPMATILVGAATEEVVGERQRIARDAASSLQAAIKGGVVPGGGALEIAVARELTLSRQEKRGMSAYGVDAVVEALKRPLAQIVANAGFNPLEKVEEVWAAQMAEGNNQLGIDCDLGTVASMSELGVADPAEVKSYALKAAGEVAEAILRIDTIIKRKDPVSPPGAVQESSNSAALDF
ncbi:MAG: chaperonin [Firmicutes bacterium]|jgi:chaperonin GroEL (HSP60 family)|nr:chaperonin [Bacillota bacterium]